MNKLGPVSLAVSLLKITGLYKISLRVITYVCSGYNQVLSMFISLCLFIDWMSSMKCFTISAKKQSNLCYKCST